MAIFPTDYTDKTTLVAGDKVWGYDSEAVSNRNFLLSAIKNFVLSGLSTTDISEGTNLYYTEARVTANTTVVGLGTTKADKSNVLEKDNTTSYTPTANYHPATKLYVDSYAIPDATTLIKGKIRLPTTSEASNGTDTTTAMTPKDVSDNYRYKERVMVASSNLKVSADTVRTNSTGTIIKVKEVLITRKGSMRVSFDLRRATALYTVSAEIRINGSTVFSTSSSSSTYTTHTQDFTIAENDTIQLWIQGANDPVTCEIRNFRIYYDINLIDISTVNLD